MLASWVRPIPGRGSGEDLLEQVDLLESERDRFERLYLAQRLRSQAFAHRLRELEALPETALRQGGPPVVVSMRITGRDATRPAGDIELLRPRYAGRLLREGDVAVSRGRHLVGRLVHVAPARVLLQPITHRGSGLLQGGVLHAGTGDWDLVPVLLRPVGDGTLVADVNARAGVAVSDLVVLADAQWPAWAQAMVIGRIESVQPRDDAPLRNRILVRPEHPFDALSWIALLASPDDPVNPGGT